VGHQRGVDHVTARDRDKAIGLATIAGAEPTRGPEAFMVWLAMILLVAWLLGWGVFHVAGSLIHLLLVVALVVFLVNFISGRRTV
jgi:hypothetical protein